MSTYSTFSTQRAPPGLVVAQTVGITASLFLFGAASSLSFIAIPAAMQASPPLAAKQWDLIYTRGAAMAVPTAILSAIATGYVAYSQDSTSTSFKLNIAATVLLPCIIPFTMIFIAPTVDKLKAKKDQLTFTPLESKTAEAGVTNSETVYALLDKWAVLNLARSSLMAISALCAVLAALDKSGVVGAKGVGFADGANRMGLAN